MLRLARGLALRGHRAFVGARGAAMLKLARDEGVVARDLGRAALGPMVRACRELDIDVINAHSLRMTLVAGVLRRTRAVGARLVSTVHNVHDRRNDRLAYPVLRWLPDAVLFASRYEQARLARVWGRSLGRVLYTGVDPVDPESVVPADLSERHGLPPGARAIGYVGRLSAEKGLDDALAALAELPSDVVLVLVGSGPEREHLEREAKERGLAERLRFCGFQDDVAAYLRSFELLVLPSRRESLPVVLREAGMLAVPCVAADVGGVAEVVVDGETGLLYPTGDVAALTRAVSRLLDDPELASDLGRRARARVGRLFTSQRWLDETEAVLAGDGSAAA